MRRLGSCEVLRVTSSALGPDVMKDVTDGRLLLSLSSISVAASGGSGEHGARGDVFGD